MSKNLIKKLVSFTKEDEEFIKEQALKLGMTSTGYLRLLIMKEKERVKQEVVKENEN